ncbi:hypothetical protein ACSTG9_23595, partial [Vibrio parahaemolyticus]
QLYMVAFFSFFGSFSHHTDCFGPNQLERNKTQARDNIHITHIHSPDIDSDLLWNYSDYERA